MKYKLIKRTNPLNRLFSKWYAAPVNDGRISKTDIAKEIAALSSLSRGDVSNVIENLIDVLPKYLLMGKSINLAEFGTLRLSFTSKGVDNINEFHIGMISGLKVIFTPSSEFKKILSNIKFEKSE
jgi:predicted histone-like DNA-binding protein